MVRDGGADIIGHSMKEEDVLALYKQPWVMVASDGGIDNDHPRGAGTFPRVLGRFVREKHLFTLEEAIRKMTSLPASRMKLADRGRIAPGMKADLVLFDPATVIDRSTFAEPRRLAEGIVLDGRQRRGRLEGPEDDGSEARTRPDPGGKRAGGEVVAAVPVADAALRSRRRMRKLLPATVLALVFAGGATVLLSSAASVSTPVITEPASDGQVISPYDVHMVAGPFAALPARLTSAATGRSGRPPPTSSSGRAPCATGSGKVHVHLGDGTFAGSLDGRHQLNSGSAYRLRVRFLGGAAPAGADWSDWAVREFATAAATAVQPIRPLGRVRRPRAGAGGTRPGSTWSCRPRANGRRACGSTCSAAGRCSPSPDSMARSNVLSNPAPVAAHGALRVIVVAGSDPLALPASVLFFTDGSGEDRQVFLPPIALAADGTASWWIAESGGAFADATGGDPAAAPVFDSPVTEPPVPWAVRQPGFRVDRFASGFQLPVNIAFAPAPGPSADAPLFYVSELYGSVKVVTRNGTVSDYATDLLNFDPTGAFPGSGEKGVTGIVVDPGSGDVFVSSIFAVAGVTDFHFPEVMRLRSDDGGRTASARDDDPRSFRTSPWAPRTRSRT